MQPLRAFLSYKIRAWDSQTTQGKISVLKLTNQLSKKAGLFVIDLNTE